MFGSVTASRCPCDGQDRAAGAAPCWLTAGLTRNFRKSTASGGASLPMAKPSPPPNARSACAGPAVDGREREPAAFVPRPFLSLVLPSKVAGRPLAHQVHRRSAVAHRGGLAVGGVPSRRRGSPAGTAHRDELLELVAGLDEAGRVEVPLSVAALVIASCRRGGSTGTSTRNAPAICPCSPTAIGVMPAYFSFWMSASNSVQVAGGAVDAGLGEEVLVVPEPHQPRLYGTPYCLPSILKSPTLRG